MADERVLRLKVDPRDLEQGIRRAQAQLRRLGDSAQRTERHLDSLVTGFRGATAALAAIGVGDAVRRLGLVTRELALLGSAAEETRNKFGAVFGSSAGGLGSFLSDFSNRAGLATAAAQNLTASTGVLLQGMGFLRSESAAVAEQALRLSADWASFADLPTEQVLEGINAALAGETERLRPLIGFISQADVAERALADTGKTLEGTLTRQERAMATLAIFTERSESAIGDLDRTSDSAANQMRRLQASVTDLRTEVGTGLVPALSEALDLLNEFIDKQGQSIVATGSGFFGAAIGAAQGFVDTPLPGQARGSGAIVQAIIQGFESVRNAEIASIAATVPPNQRPAGFPSQDRLDEARQRAAQRAAEEAARAEQAEQRARAVSEALKGVDDQLRTLTTTANVFGQGVDLNAQIGAVRSGITDLVSQGLTPASVEIQNLVGVLRELEGAARDQALSQVGLLSAARRGRTEFGVQRIGADLTRGAPIDSFDVQRVLPGSGDPVVKLFTEPLESLREEANAAAQALAGLPREFDGIRRFLSDNLDPTRILSGVASSLISGGISSIVSGAAGLFSESDESRQRRITLESNTAALDRLTRGVGELGRGLLSTSGNTFGSIDDAIDRALALQGPNPLVNEVAVDLAFRRNLEQAGLTFADAARLAQEYSITLDGTVASLEAFNQALDLNAFERFFNTPEGQFDLAQRRFDLLDIDDPNAQIRELQRILINSTSGSLQDAFRDLDFTGSNPNAFIEDFLDDLASGAITREDLGDLGVNGILDIIAQLERLGDAAEGTAQGLQEVERILNNPSGFRVDLARFLASDPVGPPVVPPPEPTSPPAGTIPPSAPPGAPSGPNPGSGATPVGSGEQFSRDDVVGQGLVLVETPSINVTLQVPPGASRADLEQLWDGLEQVIVDRANQGGAQRIQRVLRASRGSLS